MMNHVPTKELGYAIGTVLLLMATYVAAYFALVVPYDLYDRTSEPFIARLGSIPTYRIGGDSLEPFFNPIHQFDRRIHPMTWENYEVHLPTRSE
jgi:hypothetical protein